MVILGFAVVAVATGGATAERATEDFERPWADLAAAAPMPAVLAFSIWLGRRRGRRDEYLRQLLITMVAWSSWTVLAGS